MLAKKEINDEYNLKNIILSYPSDWYVNKKT